MLRAIDTGHVRLDELVTRVKRDHERVWLWTASYHFARPHQSLEVRIRGSGQLRYRTPAMAAGLTRKRWTVAEVLMMPVPENGVFAPFPVV